MFSVILSNSRHVADPFGHWLLAHSCYIVEHSGVSTTTVILSNSRHVIDLFGHWLLAHSCYIVEHSGASTTTSEIRPRVCSTPSTPPSRNSCRASWVTPRAAALLGAPLGVGAEVGWGPAEWRTSRRPPLLRNPEQGQWVQSDPRCCTGRWRIFFLQFFCFTQVPLFNPGTFLYIYTSLVEPRPVFFWAKVVLLLNGGTSTDEPWCVYFSTQEIFFMELKYPFSYWAKVLLLSKQGTSFVQQRYLYFWTQYLYYWAKVTL